METTAARPSGQQLELRVRIDQLGDESLPDAAAYVFDEADRLLVSENLVRRDSSTFKLQLSLPGDFSARRLRVMVAPAMSEKSTTGELPQWMQPVLEQAGQLPRSALYETLLRRGGVERKVRVGAKEGIVDIAVARGDWTKWLQCSCQVRGRLVKRVKMADGSTASWGVCHACVQIWEVDAVPLVLARIPDEALIRIRDELIELLKSRPLPRPKIPLPLLAAPAGAAAGLRATNSAAGELLASPLPASSELEAIAYASSAVQIRNALAVAWKPHAFILCSLGELVSHLHKHLLKCVCTDEDGYFDTSIDYSCAGDHPDLYFSAGQCIDGSWHWLYDPGLKCHVHWNHACGSDVILETRDPQARVCAPSIEVDPPAGVLKWVMPYAIGGIPVQKVKATGLVDHGFDFDATDAPWGAVLGFRVGHAASIPTAQIRYYRWLVKKPGATAFVDLAAPAALGIYKTYVDYDLSAPLKPPSFPLYFLGPKGVNSMLLYEFRPHEPPALPGHHREWPGGDYAGEIYSAMVDSSQLDHGLHSFRLEVYNESGVKVSPAPADFQFILRDLSGIDSHVVTAGEGLVDGGFEFSLYLDNRNCDAAIDAPTAGGLGANPDCGFLQFNPADSVGLSVHAVHPENRARFRHWARRGANVLFESSGEVAASSVAIVPGGPTPADQILSGDGSGHFTASLSTGFLLGSCSQAAFAEMLEVYAKATNGWDRLHGLDAQTEWAFALTPAKSHTP